jgi:phosphohistidine phosphatase
MRHGPAEDQASTGRDFDRRLSPRGRMRTERVALELRARGESPKRVLSSPLRRTVETAEIVIATLKLPIEAELRDELAPGGPAAGLVQELLREGAKRVMLVGHEPDVSALTEQLLPGWGRSFDKAMVVAFKLSSSERAAGSGKLAAECRFVIEPKQLDN